jgi:endoglucanase
MLGQLIKIVAWLSCCLMSACAIMPAELNGAEWSAYRDAFIAPDGRVIDTGADGISHSEGQGTAMLLAVVYDDPETFARVWAWTRSNLQVREDRLFAWKWDPSKTVPVMDLNNASDGDVLIAWALIRAARRWKSPVFADEATLILQDIKARLLKKTSQGLVLLPGAAGFSHGDMILVNLSYWIFPAFEDFDRFQPSPEWDELRSTGVTLINQARFGRWQLPPDWVQISPDVTLPADFKPRFSYDAIRIPLYLVWGKKHHDVELDAFKNFWEFFEGAPFTPAWTDLTDNSVGTYDAAPGFYSIMRLVYAASGSLKTVHRKTEENSEREPYYSNSLRLLTAVARKETHL